MRPRLPWMIAAAATILFLQSYLSVSASREVIHSPPAISPWEHLRKPFTPAPTNQIAYKDLYKSMRALGIPSRAIIIADMSYFVVAPPWWEKFNSGWPSILKAAGFLYKPDKEDCDDFARFYATTACHVFSLHYRDLQHTILIGEFWYHPDALLPLEVPDRHAVVMVGVWVGGKLGVQFIEPQFGKPICLSATEIQSCFFARF